MLPCMGMIACCVVRQAAGQLPKPHYRPDASDPKWLVSAVQFHGHLGPWAVAGLRAGMTGRKAVGAEGYFDIEVTVEGPMVKTPESCFLDGLQVSTGATLGKRNLKWGKADEIVVRVKDTHTGTVAKLRPTQVLMQLLTSFKPRPKTAEDEDEDADDHDEHDEHDDRADRELEAIARKIAAMPEKELFRVTLLGK